MYKDFQDFWEHEGMKYGGVHKNVAQIFWNAGVASTSKEAPVPVEEVEPVAGQVEEPKAKPKPKKEVK